MVIVKDKDDPLLTLWVAGERVRVAGGAACAVGLRANPIYKTDAKVYATNLAKCAIWSPAPRLIFFILYLVDFWTYLYLIIIKLEMLMSKNKIQARNENAKINDSRAR